MKIYSPPNEIGNAPDFPLPFTEESYKQFQVDEQSWIDKLSEWCRFHGKGPNAGKEVAFPQGDGAARYMVLTNTSLVWMPLGDAWQYPYIERLTAKDIKQRIEQAEKISALFSRRK
jgi:hypothetical protein